MDFQAKVANPVSLRSDCLVLGVYEKKHFTSAAKAIDDATDQMITKVINQGDFSGSQGETLWLYSANGIKAQRVLLVGLGKANDECSPEAFIKLIKKVSLSVKNSKSKDVCFFVGDVNVKGCDEEWKASQVAKCQIDELYLFTSFKSSPKKPAPLKKGFYIVADSKQLSAAKAGSATGQALARGMALTKELGNLPGNVCTPSYLAAEARKLARGQTRLTTRILNEKQMKDLGMGSLLSVSAGSDQPAQLIIMEYKGGKNADKPLVLVGKGITFDTGGISLKPGANMDEMKYDMCGAASVFGTLKALLELQLPVNVVGIVAAAENMPSGRATKPGDIVTSMSGQTIEVLNTDAEGRLVLCDALTYAERYKPKAVVDIATLTGACIVALGKHASGLFSNSDKLAQQLLDAGQKAGDKAWQMPLWDEYQEQLDSNFADIANIGGPGAGSVTAACFLSRFTKQYDWAHLDIAGTAWLSGAAKGASGRPVPLLLEFIKAQQ